ncbi:MAG TPA: transglutaminase family protein [Bryobacteraceae bacterium]|nr:transglutaminase family protein [Bryobacteraceae bacterium]
MAIQVALNHRTSYKYDRRINLGPQVVRLRPAPHCRTPILSYSLKVTPANHFINWQQDPQSNYLARLVFPEKADELVVEVDLIAEMAVINPFDYFLEPYAEEYPFTYEAALAKDLEPYRALTPMGPLLQKFVDSVPRVKRGSVDFLIDLNRRVQSEIGYTIRLDAGIQSSEETLELGIGSCRDSSWLLVQIFRQLGLAARFVSGYLIQLVADVKSIDGPSGASSDFTDLHAWVEVYLPGAGWIGFDPTSGLLAGEGHIPLACTPDASSAAPINGLVDPCNVDFHHSMSVHRVNETPRVTKPYSEQEWRAIEELARNVDADLEDGDVRLTMGGEPTFVGIDEPDSPQWNGDALGPLKRNRAVTLIRRIQKRKAPGALLHFGQGKWYPGEPLPRWALGCYWRVDGVPIWENHELIAEEDKDYRLDQADALRFAKALTQRLQVNAENIIPAYEDAFYYLWRERRLPVNVDALDSKIDNPQERKRLARVFEEGFADPVGYVLPLRRRGEVGQQYWSSQPWFVRPDRLLLVEGDSAMGYRLPLNSLPWVAPEDTEYDYDADPFGEQIPLPARPPRRMDLFAEDVFEENAASPGDLALAAPKAGTSARGTSRPALCVQAREGRMHVFLPPTQNLTDYLDLIASIEDTCAYLQMPIWLEGYTPSHDARLHVLKITPDPGVVEVNIPPARNWEELVETTTTVYEEARESRLATEKFMHDGKHTGTGGGNHIVIGGAAPTDSPLLRRPDLLRSLVSFWQNHPSLSYLLSGLFIGPTSQHPRVDEARMDSLYELEIAFNQMPDGPCPPWLVDRLFRNLLVDMTGNTHRAEFCIDKLYPPETGASRLGLLELRAFEMPPHPRMSLTQNLLLRALVAKFWEEPYEGQLIPWGTALHDRFMLPHFVTQDFHDVLAFLRRFGYAFKERWFESHIEFRFPKVGVISTQGVTLELRQALEPWHVLGEEAGQSGTVRNVDSSLERMQVKVSGLTGTRYTVTCNGRKLPLQPTGMPGEAVAGVRYRAWQPPACLHPTIGVHAPLVFDIVDDWNGRSVGGGTYHVTHPGGRNYTVRPVNAYEAEGRRLARFQESGHTAGQMTPQEETPNPNFPMTLDLRWPTRQESKRPRTGAASA